MRNPNRIDDVLQQIGELWKMVPDWRFMQLICNFQRFLGSDGFYIEDDKLVEKIKEWFE